MEESTRFVTGHTIDRSRSRIRLGLELDLRQAQVEGATIDGLMKQLQDYVDRTVLGDLRSILELLEEQPETGVVKFFDEAKGWGYIRHEDRDLFVHWKHIATPGYKTLQAGQMVQFRVRQGWRSPEAYAVEILQ